MEDLESEGSLCQNCSRHLISIAPQALFFACGCVICPGCQEDMQECPAHNKDLYRCPRDPTMEAKLQEINRLYEQYEKEYHTSERPELDGLVMQLRLYVKSKGEPRAVQPQSAYQPLPNFTNFCPNCRIQMTGLRCQCGYVDFSEVRTADMKTVKEEYVLCMHCRKKTTPQGQPNCYDCGKPLNNGNYPQIGQFWACPHCSYAYNMEASCVECLAPKSDSRVIAPPSPVKQSSTLVWTCAACSYEYNLQTVGTCQRCNRQRGEQQAGWKCSCGSFNPVNQTYCSYCRKPKPTQPVPPPSTAPRDNEGGWKCSKCKKENRAQVKSCYYCKGSRVVLNAVPSAPRTAVRQVRYK